MFLIVSWNPSMIKKETIAAPRPMAMLATAILWVMEENPSFCSLLILFDMKYPRFKILA